MRYPPTCYVGRGNLRQETARYALAQYLTIDEVCTLLKLGKRTVYELCREGKLAGAAKVGNQWRVNRLQLDEWLAAGGDAAGRTNPATGTEGQS